MPYRQRQAPPRTAQVRDRPSSWSRPFVDPAVDPGAICASPGNDWIGFMSQQPGVGSRRDSRIALSVPTMRVNEWGLLEYLAL